MSGVRYRRRGTAIVETEHGILLTAGRYGKFILPSGGAKRGESGRMTIKSTGDGGAGSGGDSSEEK